MLGRGWGWGGVVGREEPELGTKLDSPYHGHG